MSYVKDNDTHHIHEDVSDHDHGSLMIGPCTVQCLQEFVIQECKYILPNLNQNEQPVMSEDLYPVLFSISSL